MKGTTKVSTTSDWSQAPAAGNFYGREPELLLLEERAIRDRHRLVCVTGMKSIGKTQTILKFGEGGIGKSELTSQLARRAEREFEFCLWISLINRRSASRLLDDIVSFVSQHRDAQEAITLEDKIERALYYLKRHRCLLVLDNLESLLRAKKGSGEFDDGYKEYELLFKALATVDHQSCVMVSSRETPRIISQLAGSAKKTSILELSGLDVTSARKIFRDLGEFQGTDNEWEKLNAHFGGNPLALDSVARQIIKMYGGKLGHYLKTSSLRHRDIENVLKWHYDRLTAAEREILIWLAISRAPVTLLQLKKQLLSSRRADRIDETVESLSSRIKIETDRAVFSLQPVIVEYCTRRFVNDVIRAFKNGTHDLRLKSHALLQADATDYVRAAQSDLIVSQVTRGIVEQFGRRHVDHAINKFLIKGRKDKGRKTYLAGNLLNVLSALSGTLSGWDFSEQFISQAFLQSVELRGVDFSGATFDRVALRQQFGCVLSVAIGPDFIIAAGDAQGEVRLWNSLTGALLNTLRGHFNWVWSVAFRRNGGELVSGGEDKLIKIWDVETGRCRLTIETQAKIWSVCWHPIEAVIACAGDDGFVGIYSSATGKLVNSWKGHQGRVWAAEFDGTGEFLFTGGDDTTAKRWDSRSGALLNTYSEHSGWVTTLAVSRSSLVTGSSDASVIVRDLGSGKVIGRFAEHGGIVRSVAVTKDGALVAAGSDNRTVRLWNVRDGACVNVLRGHVKPIWSVALTEDGYQVVSGSEDNSVRIFAASTGVCERTLRGYSNWVWAAAVSRDGSEIMTGGDDGFIRFWDKKSGQCTRAFGGHTARIRALRFLKDGKQSVSCGDDHTIRVWDENGRTIHLLDGHRDWVRALDVSDSQNYLISGGSDCEVKLWELTSGRCLRTLGKHADWVMSVAFSPTGQMAASASADGVVKLWKVNSNTKLWEHECHQGWVWSVAFSTDGEVLITAGEDATIRLWSVSSGKLIKEITEHAAAVRTIAVSSDGDTFGSASEDGMIQLWSISTLSRIQKIHAHHDWVLSLAFAERGRVIISGSRDGTIKSWRLKSRRLVGSIRIPRPYEGTNITGVVGITAAERSDLLALGAIQKIETPKRQESEASGGRRLNEFLSWCELNCGEDSEEGLRTEPNRTMIATSWERSEAASESDARCFRAVCAFCALSGLSFPLRRSEWLTASGRGRQIDEIFEEELLKLRTYGLAEILELNELPADPKSVGRQYRRARDLIEARLDKQKITERPAKFVRVTDAGQTHRRRDG